MTGNDLKKICSRMFGRNRRRKGISPGAAAVVDVLEARRLLVAPQMIENVMAAQTGPPSLGITWDADPNAAQYEVRIDGTHFRYEGSAVVSTNQHEVIFTGQEGFSANTYDIAVRGLSSEGEAGPWSDTISAVFEAVPNAPEPPQFVNDNLDGPYYTRNDFFGFRGGLPEYDIWVNKDGVDGPYRREVLTTNRFQFDSEFGGGVFRIWIRGRDSRLVEEYQSDWIGPMTIAIGGEQTVVTGAGGQNASRPTLTWSQGVPDVDYQLWVNATDGPSRVILETNLTTNSFTATADLPDGFYTAWVRQTPKSSAPLPWSESFRFGVGEGFAIPAAPTVEVRADNFALVFNWNSVDNADRYELWLSDMIVGRIQGDDQLALTEYTTSPFTPTGRGKDFRVWVRAFSGGGTAGPWSAPLTFTLRTDGTIA